MAVIPKCEATSRKNQPNGYAGLDENGLVPAANLPAGQGGAAWGAVTGTLSDQLDLQAALNGKEATGVAAAGDAIHAAAADPHPLYTLSTELVAHEGAADPHPAYALDSDLTSHIAAADPHTAYQRESEKGAANGYASLGAGTKVPTTELGGAGADNTKFLRGDQTWAVPASSAATVTAGVGTSPTSSSTQQITHNLGRTPVVIRIHGRDTFLANAAALPPTGSTGLWCSSGNVCVYQPYDAATVTAAEPAATSTAYAIRQQTGVGNFATGVIGNVTSTTFDIVWTETGTHTAQVYLWEAS